MLTKLAREFVAMTAALDAMQISHGDLQDENIIVQLKAGKPLLKLIDYDSLYVPELSGYPEQIIGISNYQHPLRGTLNASSEITDYFSQLVIYLSLVAISDNPKLWRTGVDKQMLFVETDFSDPERSPTIERLLKEGKEVKTLTGLLIEYCRQTNLRALRPLSALLSDHGIPVRRATRPKPAPALPPADATISQPAAGPPQLDPSANGDKWRGFLVRNEFEDFLTPGGIPPRNAPPSPLSTAVSPVNTPPTVATPAPRTRTPPPLPPLPVVPRQIPRPASLRARPRYAPPVQPPPNSLSREQIFVRVVGAIAVVATVLGIAWAVVQYAATH
jgi:hypothetical protein